MIFQIKKIGGDVIGLENDEILLSFKRRKRNHYGGDYESKMQCTVMEKNIGTLTT